MRSLDSRRYGLLDMKVKSLGSKFAMMINSATIESKRLKTWLCSDPDPSPEHYKPEDRPLAGLWFVSWSITLFQPQA